jgi:uncharacterized protein involved in tellurium resistance
MTYFTDDINVAVSLKVEDSFGDCHVVLDWHSSGSENLINLPPAIIPCPRH